MIGRDLTPAAPPDMTMRQLVRSPGLPLYIRQLHDMLEEERKRRERFYAEMPEGQKVEFINGEVIVHSPAKLRHTIVGRNLLVLLSAYVSKHRAGLVGHEKMLICLTRNDYEPDICYFQPKPKPLPPTKCSFRRQTW